MVHIISTTRCRREVQDFLEESFLNGQSSQQQEGHQLIGEFGILRGLSLITALWQSRLSRKAVQPGMIIIMVIQCILTGKAQHFLLMEL